MTFRYVASIDVTSIDAVPQGFTGRVKVYEHGKLDRTLWLRKGELDNPHPDTAAFVRYRADGGVKQIRHYWEGRLHDPRPGYPAVVGYFADSSMKYREHYRYGRRHDSGPTPAITKWRNDGSVRSQLHYFEGLRIDRIDAVSA